MAEAYAAMQEDTSRIRGFRIGRVVAKAFRVYFANFLYINLSAIVVWIPIIATSSILYLINDNRAFFGDYARWALAVRSAQQAIGGAAILLLLLYPICGAIIFHAVFRSLRDGKMRFLASVSQGFARGFYVILLFIIGFLALALATTMVFYPVVFSYAVTIQARNPATALMLAAILPTYLAVMWSVALPACVVEGLGPIASLGRSRRLTLGYRWRILVVGLIFTALFALLFFSLRALSADTNSMWRGLLVLLGVALASAFAFVIPATIYHELRHAKEGRDIQSLAAVFD